MKKIILLGVVIFFLLSDFQIVSASNKLMGYDVASIEFAEKVQKVFKEIAEENGWEFHGSLNSIGDTSYSFQMFAPLNSDERDPLFKIQGFDNEEGLRKHKEKNEGEKNRQYFCGEGKWVADYDSGYTYSSIFDFESGRYCCNQKKGKNYERSHGHIYLDDYLMLAVFIYNGESEESCGHFDDFKEFWSRLKTELSKGGNEEESEDCNNRQVYIDGTCVDISDFCGPDFLIEYDVEKEECYCPIGYKMDGNMVCNKEGIIKLDVNVIPGNPELPLLADGETGTKFLVTGKYIDDNAPADLSFTVGYSRTEKKGSIVSVEGNKHSGYMVTYQTADLGEIDGQPMDYIYAHYANGKTGKPERNQFEVGLYTYRISDMVIKRLGMQAIQRDVSFKQENLRIRLYAEHGGQEYPVVAAKIVYENGFTAETDEKGEAVLRTSKKVYGGNNDYNKEENIIKIKMELDSTLSSIRDKGLDYYKKVGVENAGVYDFLNNFIRYFVVLDDERDMKKMSAGMNLVPYSLMMMHESERLEKDAAKNVGITFGGALSGFIELTEITDKIAKKLVGPLERLGEKGLQVTSQEFSDLYEDVTSLPGDTVSFGWGKIRSTILAKAPFLDPDILDYIFDTVLGDYADTKKTVKGEIEGGVSEIEGNIKGAMDSFIENFDAVGRVESALNDYYANQRKELMNKIEKKIQKNDFVEVLVEINIEHAKSNYRNMAEQYLGQVELEYKADMFKAYSELLIEVGTKTAKISTAILAPEFYTVVSEACDKIESSYGILDKAIIQNAKVVTWFIVYAHNLGLMEDSVDALIQSDLSNNLMNPTFSNMSMLGLQPVLAFSEDDSSEWNNHDELKKMYENKIDQDNSKRQTVFDYYNAKNDLGFYGRLANIMETIHKAQPDSEEIREIYDRIIGTTKEKEKEISEKKEIVEQMDILGINYAGKKESWRWWILLPVVLVAGVLGFKFYKKKIKK